MSYFYFKPEVAGSFCADSIVDRSVEPPLVEKVHYELESWRGDSVLEAFPIFVVTQDVQEAIVDAGLTGAEFAEAEMTKASTYQGIDRAIPAFVSLRAAGEPGRDDLATGSKGRLIVSQRALDLMQGFGIEHGYVKPFE